ncbi:hypothetical protein [Aeromonas sp. FDAARGOS 1407]|uniref:hypothetical protein n=1 Tax=Aeromonas TaxID=642 RepID=UPI001C24A7CF|nr:hypothetical protein [Aeromonas sp. FDAARGOS 1407]QXC33268.1 hypothetical protein I6L37_17050 [Aeromonas sp. FDAARGOS 1407]
MPLGIPHSIGLMAPMVLYLNREQKDGFPCKYSEEHGDVQIAAPQFARLPLFTIENFSL